ncbi:glycosyltransferase family 4 protein [Vibrio diazotrophicus]|uniref:Glycosyltransferase family 1 protein n=1 Tax=Vibrio diazotrophicus TaxID=685 RepID=A0ABX4WAI8_VIBDI|nr:glycosyltransferase family 1 protein [Vibrio diazotrophicus]PNI00924.1 glycosyltransferase family 1 protein [Vibrio diazotrophicus]
MRIVIDMQGAQSESRFRGIGCYTMAFAQAVVRNCGEHEVILAVSGLFPETIEPIRAAFDKLLPQNNIRVWYTPGPVLERHTGNDDTRKIAELIREDFIEKLQPDVVHVTSLFEGYIDDAVTSTRNLGQKTIISVTTYDLIPLLNPQQYLDPHPIYKTYYHRKIEELKKADVLLAISEYAKTEIIDSGLVSESKVFNVSTAIDDSFEKCTYSKDEKRSLNSKFNIKGEFILYTGGADERKNLPRLIEAYALLSEQLRKEHQLVFAGRMPSGDIDRFKAIAKSHGLKSEDILFTGYIEQEELIALYNLCKLYVFPSWHEGFGLPALEAMLCGAPVIGANTTSLPEVIGFEDALFDPMNVSQINQKMKLALTDSDYRKSLCENASNQVGKFSWDITAKKAIEAWESLYKSNKLSTENAVSAECYSLIEKITPYINPKDENRIREISSHLAHNEGVGVQRQLLLDISELYHRDAATGVQRVVRNYLYHLLNCPPKDFEVLPVYAKQDQGYYYAFDYVEKLLGHQVSKLENTPIRIQRGDVFFGLDMQHHVQLAHVSTYEQLRQSGVVIKFLVHDLLPIQLSELFKDNDAKELHEKWLRMIAQQDEAICVSKATADAFEEWITTYSARTKANFQISWVHNGADINESQFIPETSEETKVLGKLKSRPTFLCVSTIEPRKGQEQILDAFELLWQEEQFDFNLVFVGQQGWNVDKLASRLSNHSENGHRLFWLQGINDSYLNRVYQASTCLLAASINEGFGLSLIEAASHKIPVIARDIPVFREVAGDAAFYFKGETGEELAISIESWFQSLNKGEVPNSSNMKWSTWQESSEKLKVQLVENNCPQKQLLVDVSELVKRDAKTGIQRVVREILKHWLSNPPSGYQVVPVYATTDALGYRYAHNFLNQFLQLHQTREIEDTFVDVWQGDMFVGLDLQHAVLSTQFELLKDWRNRGVKIWFVIYDLLPVLLPQYFPPESEQYHQEWLELVSEFDGVACISESVAGEYQEWLDKQGETQRLRPIKIKSFPLGVDQKSSLNTKGIPDDGNVVLDAISSSNSFLMVGTIEPRKGHVQVLDAFEHLWAEGGEQTLVIVGKKGWMVDPLMKRLENHSQLRKRLFIISNCSDEYLEKIYEKSKCLIAASYGEGFGLPLIEAAKHNLPIIARDIPVFREVAGSNAQFFKGDTGQELLHAIYDWLEDYHNRNHVSSRNIKWVTWEESSFILISILN